MKFLPKKRGVKHPSYTTQSYGRLRLNITINQKVLKYVMNKQSKDEESLVKQAFFNVIRLTLLWQKKPPLSFNEYVRIL